MDYYYIIRKSKKGDEFLHVTKKGTHVWRTNTNMVDAFSQDEMQSKVKTLRLYGRKDCFYRPMYAYHQEAIF